MGKTVKAWFGYWIKQVAGLILRVLIPEVIGVFFINFLTGIASYQLVGVTNTRDIALAYGFITALMSYVLYPVSGAYLNSMRVICFMIDDRTLDTFLKSIGMLLQHLVGSILSGVALKYTQPESLSKNGLGYPKLGEDTTIAQGFFFEAISSFFFMFVIVAVILFDKTLPGNRATIPSLSAAINLVIYSSIGMVGGVSVSMNPARTLGPALFSEEGLFVRGWWIYYTANFLGGFLGYYFGIFMAEDKDSDIHSYKYRYTEAQMKEKGLRYQISAFEVSALRRMIGLQGLFE